MIISPLFVAIIISVDFSQENADHQSSSTNTVQLTDDVEILAPSTPPCSMADFAQIKFYVPKGIFVTVPELAVALV